MGESIRADQLTVKHIGMVIEAQSGNGPTIKDELVHLFMGVIERGEEKGQVQVNARFKNVSPARGWERGGQLLEEFFGLNVHAPVIIHGERASE